MASAAARPATDRQAWSDFLLPDIPSMPARCCHSRGPSWLPASQSPPSGRLDRRLPRQLPAAPALRRPHNFPGFAPRRCARPIPLPIPPSWPAEPATHRCGTDPGSRTRRLSRRHRYRSMRHRGRLAPPGTASRPACGQDRPASRHWVLRGKPPGSPRPAAVAPLPAIPGRERGWRPTRRAVCSKSGRIFRPPPIVCGPRD